MANYLVGRITNIFGSRWSNFFYLNRCKTGRVNANVLPEPVLSLAIMS
jgi:hypothetical protein